VAEIVIVVLVPVLVPVPVLVLVVVAREVRVNSQFLLGLTVLYLIRRVNPARCVCVCVKSSVMYARVHIKTSPTIFGVSLFFGCQAVPTARMYINVCVLSIVLCMTMFVLNILVCMHMFI